MRRTLVLGFALPCLLFSLAFTTSGCGGGGGGGGGGGAGSGSSGDVDPAQFGGVRSAAVAGGAFVRLDWRSAVDAHSNPAAITYRVYASATSGTQNFSAPIASAGGGATSIILSAATSPLIAVGADVFLVVRSVDAAGNVDGNATEIVASPVAAASIAFVSDTAGGAGSLGDPSDPFLTVQAGLAAVEGNGGGAVLVDASAAGTTYAEEVNFTAAVSSIALYGGFARFSALPAAASGATILATRAVATNRTILSGAGLLPLADGDLVRVDNSSSPTYVDGFEFDGMRPTTAALTGTITLYEGRTIVDGVGTLFLAEAPSPTEIQLDGVTIPVRVNSADSDTRLTLRGPYRGPTMSGTASTVGAPELFLQAVNAFLQVSCCTSLDGAAMEADTTAITDASTVRLIGNDCLDIGPDAFQIGGGIRHVRVQNNHVTHRGQAVTSTNSATTDAHVLSAGSDIWITDNLFVENNPSGQTGDMVEFKFLPADAGNGGALVILAERNEMRSFSGEGFNFRGVGEVGANGSATVTVRRNFITGSSQSQVEIDTQLAGGAPFAGVDIDIQIYENDLPGSNSIQVDVDIGVSAGRRTTLAIRDNLLAIGESEAIEITDEEGGAAGASDGGTFDLSCIRNTVIGGLEDIEWEVGVPHGGLTRLLIMENTVLSSEDEAFNVDPEGYIGTTGAVFPSPDGVYCLSVFNNDAVAHDDEAWALDDERELGSFLLGYFGHGFNLPGSDAFDGAVVLGAEREDAAWLLERNFNATGGGSGNQAGIEIDTFSSDLRNQMRFLNNVCTLASGGGIEWRAGPWAQFINNTCAYAGQSATNPEAGFEFVSGIDGGDSQALVLNCLAAYSGGNDVDFRNGIRPVYTLVRDDSVAGGLGNLLGTEPYFATDVSRFNDFAASHRDLQSILQLRPTSPAVDAGHPGSMYNDPNGSRNDMGAYGGPGAGPIGIKAAGTSLPLVYVGTFPATHLYTGALLVPDTQVLRFGFSRAVDQTTLAAGITVSVPGTFTIEAEGHIVVFTPTGTLAAPFTDVVFTSSLRDTAGAALAYPWQERVAVRPAAPVAEAEPNDDGVAGISAADFVAAQATGVGPGAGVFELASSLTSAADVDAYAVTAAVGDRLMVTSIRNRLGLADDGEIHLDIYDAAGNRITEGRRNNFNDTASPGGVGDAYVDHVFETAGTYYIVITNPTAGAAQTYNLLGVLD